MTDVEIKPIVNGISFMEYLGEVFTENGRDFSRMLCENRLSIETERSIYFELEDGFDNKYELQITLRDSE